MKRLVEGPIGLRKDVLSPMAGRSVATGERLSGGPPPRANRWPNGQCLRLRRLRQSATNSTQIDRSAQGGVVAGVVAGLRKAPTLSRRTDRVWGTLASDRSGWDIRRVQSQLVPMGHEWGRKADEDSDPGVDTGAKDSVALGSCTDCRAGSGR